MSKRTDTNNGGFIAPTPAETEVQKLVASLEAMVLKLGELLLSTPSPDK
jgi:hypothetical protein